MKRLFPQHSEVGGLIQKSQQGITDGKDKTSMFGSSSWLFIVVAIVIVVVIVVIIIAVVGFLLIGRGGKSKPPKSTPIQTRPSPAPPQAPSPRSYTPTPPPAAARPTEVMGDSGKTVDLSATIAISRNDTAPMSFGSIQFVSGVLTGQKFEVKPEGSAIGRDSGSAQIVIADPRISKRHLWVGVRDGRVAIIDEGSRNGTFLNDPKSPRVTEAFLTPGDTVILGESDVARFEYQM